MDEKTRKILAWATHGTSRQFYTEVSAKVAGLGYLTEVESDTLTCYRVRKEGGFLGIGARKIREPVLRVVYHGEGQAEIPEDCVDPEFVDLLEGLLKPH